MKNWIKTLSATCAVMSVAQLAALPVPAAYAAETEAAKPATTDADPALWVLKDDDTTIYLFGTVHALKPGLTWFDDAVKKAFDSSDQLMLELVMPEDQAEIAKVMIPLAVDQTGTTLPSRLSPEDLKAYQAAMTSLGLPANQFDMFEPWLPAMTLAVLPLTKLGYDPEQGAEKQLTHYAKEAGKPIAGLETMKEQLGFFDNMPVPIQLKFLNATVDEIDQLGPMLDKMVVLWGKGDPDGLAAVMNKSMAETPVVADILLYQRNARWAKTLKARMDQPGTIFVAVGAGHLAGEKSVLEDLKSLGLQPQRIQY